MLGPVEGLGRLAKFNGGRKEMASSDDSSKGSLYRKVTLHRPVRRQGNEFSTKDAFRGSLEREENINVNGDVI